VDWFLHGKVILGWPLQSPSKLQFYTAPSLTKYSTWCSYHYSY